jgi:hypothetical protein
VTDVHTGIGDIRATGAYQLLDSRTRLGVDVALRGSLKLPTGDEANLYGSGGTDLALWLSAACEKAMCGDITGWYGGAGLLWVGKGEVLPELQREHVLFGVFGWAVRALPDITLKAQLDMHSPFYGHTELEQLNTGSVELQLGGSWALTRNTVLDIAVAEDMVVSTAPDVTFHLALRYRY